MKIRIKPHLQQCVNFLSIKLAVLGVWLNNNAYPNPNFLDDLSPIDNIANSETYEQALEWAIKNKHIKNIAVTGPYGSGKSSLLRTFEKKHPGYHYLNISLASFQDDVKIEDDVLPVTGATAGAEEKNRLIELSILQQMFYRVKNNKIPDSRFNRIRNLSFWRISLFSLFSFALGIGILILFNPAFLKRISWWTDFSKKNGDWLVYAAILLSLPAIFKIQAYILRLLNTSKFNKINLTKGEVEFDNKSETSVLNMHLDEILYFFEVTDYNVVVFEDLDRFNDPEIFTKLRELNILINKSLQIDRHVVFIYAIKDDMFKDKTRTKFFDFIIPVIPVINWSNSYEIMVGKFRQKELGLAVSEKFISAITLYIDDMRALKNIFNEFILYKENLRLVAPVQNKLLAIIIYKNIYPSEFADLHDNKGTIYETFQMKSQMVQKSMEDKRSVIQGNKAIMAKFKEILANDIPELRAIYLLAFQKLASTAVSIQIKGGDVTFEAVQNNDDHFNWLTAQANISAYHYIQHPSYGNASLVYKQPFSPGISFKQIEGLVNAELTYNDRAQLVTNERIAEIDQLDEHNQQLEKEILQLQSYSLKELLDDNGELLQALPADLLKQKLLVYLIREGYIDETYPSLISYFYEGSLTYRDMAFILNIRNREVLPFRYTLDTTENILKRLEPADFTRMQILNFNLVDYLLSDIGHKENLDKIMSQLADHKDYSLLFIDEYITEGKLPGKFFSRLFTAWQGLWDYIFDDPTYIAEQKNVYLKLIITYADEVQLKTLNKNKKLEKYLKSLPGILNSFSEGSDIERFKKIIELFSLKFYKLDEPQIPALFDCIIEHRNYALTEEMIRLIIQQKGTEPSKDDKLISTANYTAIRLSGVTELMDYVEENLPGYIESITLLLPENTKDGEEYLAPLLNNDLLSIEVREKLIDKEEAVINDIITIPKELWSKLMTANKMAVNWQNVFVIFESENGLTDELITYLNKEAIYKKLSESLSNAGTLASLHHPVDKALLSENKLTDEAYDYLVKSSGYYYPSASLEIDGLSDKKVTSLLNHRKLRLDTATFNDIKAKFPALLGLLIEKNIDDYLKSPATYPLEPKEFTHLLRSSILPGQKGKLIPLVTDDFLESDAELSVLVSGHLLAYSPVNAPTPATLHVLMKHVNLPMRRRLLDKFFKIFTKKELGLVLLFMGNDFKLTDPDGSVLVLEADDLNISLAKKIKQAGLIAGWKRKKDELTLFMNKKEE